MAVQQVTDHQDSWLDDPFLSETTDTSTLTPEQHKQFRQKFGLPEPSRAMIWPPR